MIFNMFTQMLMTFLGMKLKVTQNGRRKGRVCRMLPFPLCMSRMTEYIAIEDDNVMTHFLQVLTIA